jgi:uncharacterized protein (DUF983 family)
LSNNFIEMSQDPNLIKSVLKIKCPKCHGGDLFCNNNPYQFKGFFDMPDNCPKCGQDFQIEPGFYLGAMFVSYALTIGLNIGVFVVFLLFDAYSLIPFLIAAALVLMITIPYLTKVSRSIWIALTINYNPNAIKEYEQKT